MAVLPYITHVPSNGVPKTKNTEREEISQDFVRFTKIKIADRRQHQKPHPRRIIVVESVKVPEPQPVPQAAPLPEISPRNEPAPKKNHSFVLENPEESKASRSNPLKRVLGQLLQKKPRQQSTAQSAPTPPKKKKTVNDLSGMTRRIYYGIANALPGQTARDKAHMLFLESLADIGEDTLFLENKYYLIKDVTGPVKVDENFINLAKIMLVEHATSANVSPMQHTLSLKDFLEKLHNPSPSEPQQSEPEPTPEPVLSEATVEVTAVSAPEPETVEEPLIAPEPIMKQELVQEPEEEPTPAVETMPAEVEEPIESDRLFTPEELLNLVKGILQNAIKHVDYKELVAPFHDGTMSAEAMQQLVADTRTQNATFLVYGPKQLNQLLSALAIPDGEIEELITDSESRRSQWGIRNPEYALSFYQTIEGPRLYSLNIVEKPTNAE